MRKETSITNDSVASMHVMSKSDLTREEEDTTRKSQEFCMIISANGSVATTEEATVYVRDLDMFVTVQSLIGRLTSRARMKGRTTAHIR